MSTYDMDCEQGCRLLKVERDKLEAVKSWYETRIKKYKEQFEAAAENPPIDIVQSVVSGILFKGLEGLGEILEAGG